MYLLLKFTVPE